MKRMLLVIYLGMHGVGRDRMWNRCGILAQKLFVNRGNKCGKRKQKTDEAEALSILRDTPATDEYEQLGDTYVRQGNRPLALLQYDHALKSAPRHARVRHKKYLLFLANGLHADATAGFRALVQEQAHDVSAWEGLGRSLFQAGQDAKAEEALRQAVQENKQLWKAHALLGVLYDLRQDHDLAVSAYRTALEPSPIVLRYRTIWMQL